MMFATFTSFWHRSSLVYLSKTRFSNWARSWSVQYRYCCGRENNSNNLIDIKWTIQSSDASERSLNEKSCLHVTYWYRKQWSDRKGRMLVLQWIPPVVLNNTTNASEAEKHIVQAGIVYGITWLWYMSSLQKREPCSLNRLDKIHNFRALYRLIATNLIQFLCNFQGGAR